MARASQSEKVPQSMHPTFKAIVALTDTFCKNHLNEEYAQVARQATAALCRKRLSPLLTGTPKAWACGIVYALGHVNFLFDKNQTPYMTAWELCRGFGISKSSGAAKSKAVRDALKMTQLDPNWCLPSKLDDNPLAWMIMVNGLMVDIRQCPPDLQAAAYKKGVIPYLPETPCVDNIEPIITKQGRSMDDQSLVGRGNLKRGIHEDDVRENRISMEIVVDAYNEEERAMGWYCYLDETLHFPFRARCFTKRSISPLVVGEIIQAMKMAPSEECEHEMFVLTRWKNRTVAVPLSQLEGLVFDDETSEAIADWHYWVQRGYEF